MAAVASSNGVPAEAVPAASGIKRRKSMKKKVSAKKKPAYLSPDAVSPLKRQLEETETWTKSEMSNFASLPNARSRVEFVYSLLPQDATGIDRLWPVQIVQKDSRQGPINSRETATYFPILTHFRLRRQLSDRGKAHFLRHEFSQAMDHYNEACLFSCDKGLGHTLARRAAFLLQQRDQVRTIDV